MDRNRDNLITYEEFRYYVGVVMGDNSKLSVNNLTVSAKDEARLEVWRQQWHKTARGGEEYILKEDASENM